MNEIVRTISGSPVAGMPPTVADLLDQLGGIAAERVRIDPPLGSATIADLVAVNEAKQGPVCELVDGVLVEKAVGQFESQLAMIIAGGLYVYLRTHDIGMLLGEAAVLRILPGIGRAGDVTFIAWKSLPGGRPPPREDPIPAVVPDLVVEVLSKSNTPREMARKRDEYFRAGVKQVWEIDPSTRSAVVHTAADQSMSIAANGTLDGAGILPGFQLSLRYVFDRAERLGGGH